MFVCFKNDNTIGGKKLNSLRKEMRSLSTRCWQRGLTNEDVSAFDNTAVGGRWLSFSSGWQPVFICGRGYAASGYGCVGPMRVAPTTKTCYSSILQWRQVHLWPAVITQFIILKLKTHNKNLQLASVGMSPVFNQRWSSCGKWQSFARMKVKWGILHRSWPWYTLTERKTELYGS